jgi:hypothetical protein
MEKEIFSFLKVKYQVNNINIGLGETIHTVFVPSVKGNPSHC